MGGNPAEINVPAEKQELSPNCILSFGDGAVEGDPRTACPRSAIQRSSRFPNDRDLAAYPRNTQPESWSTSPENNKTRWRQYPQRGRRHHDKTRLLDRRFPTCFRIHRTLAWRLSRCILPHNGDRKMNKYSKNKCRVCGKTMERVELPNAGWICIPCLREYDRKRSALYRRKEGISPRKPKISHPPCIRCGEKSQMTDDSGKPICFSCWRKEAAKVIARMLDDGKIGEQK